MYTFKVTRYQCVLLPTTVQHHSSETSNPTNSPKVDTNIPDCPACYDHSWNIVYIKETCNLSSNSATQFFLYVNHTHIFYSIESIHHAGLQVIWLGRYNTARFLPLLSPLLSHWRALCLWLVRYSPLWDPYYMSLFYHNYITILLCLSCCSNRVLLRTTLRR